MQFRHLRSNNTDRQDRITVRAEALLVYLLKYTNTIYKQNYFEAPEQLK